MNLEKLSENKGTTGVGLGGIVIALIVAMIPAELKKSCFDSISLAENPLLSGTLLVAGILATVIGPSLFKKKDHSSEAGKSIKQVEEELSSRR